MRAMPPAEDSDRGAALQREVSRLAVRFGTRAHIAYLTEALVAARSAPDDPLASLALLASMQGSPYASRKDQKPALAEIGAWLEDRLLERAQRGGGITGAEVAEELGWLRRMAVAQDRLVGGGPSGPSGPIRRFGGHLERLRRLLADVPTPVETPSAGPAPVSPPEPDEIPPPDHYRVGFAHVLRAREAWKAARTRLSKNKPLKDTRIPLAVRTEPAPEGGMEVSWTLTAGLVDVFRDFDTRGGQVRDFHVVAWDAAQSPWLATRVAFDPEAD